MKNTGKNLTARVVMAATAAATLAVMTGCGLGTAGKDSGPVQMQIKSFTGSVHGGRQPIVGASIHLYKSFVTADSTYTGTSTDLLASAGIVTGPAGQFTITSQYSCSPGDQMYIVALGGDTGFGGAGSGTNNQAAIMAALGDCTTITAGTRFIQMNEVTTVGAVFALAPFMTSYASVGTSSTNVAGLKAAFVNADKLVDVTGGAAGGPQLATNATAPTTQIYTLADILASCVNTTGGAAGNDVNHTSDGTHCGDLFSYTTRTGSGNVPPTDTIGLALKIAKDPTLNAGTLLNYADAFTPYTPRLTNPPTDWALAISYSGFNTPVTSTVDGSGNIWVANSGNNTVSVLAQNGTTAQTLNGNGLSTPTAIAIDSGGNAWVADNGSNTVSAFTASGGIFGSSPFSVGPAGANPSSLAFDSTGSLWVTNQGANTVVQLSSTGATLQTLSGFSTPVAVVVDSK
jgi:hypothetical protein